MESLLLGDDDDVAQSPPPPSRGPCIPSALDFTDALIRRWFPLVQHIQVAELQQIIEANGANGGGSGGRRLLLLDAREPAEYTVSRIPGAVNVSPSAHTDPEVVRALVQAADGGDINNVVVCYCSIGFRSSQLVNALITHRPEYSGRVYNLEGSIFRWATDGGVLVSGPQEGETAAAHVVHPFNALFGRMLDANLRSSAL